MTSGLFVRGHTSESTYKVEILDTDGTTVLETITPSDLEDAITRCKRSQGRILADESIQIVVTNETTSPDDNKPNGILAKFTNVSGVIQTIHDATPSFPVEPTDDFHVWSWNTPDGDPVNITTRLSITPRDATQSLTGFGLKPEGKKYASINDTENTASPLGWDDIFGHASDMVSFNSKDFRTPFADNTISTVYGQVKTWAETVRDGGQTIDYLTFDIESGVSFKAGAVDNDPDHVEALNADAIANPTTRFGKVLTELQKYNPAITDFDFINTSAFSASSLRFNGIMTRLEMEAYNKAIIKPFKEVFPNIIVTSYRDFLVTDELSEPTVDRNGYDHRIGGIAGDYQNAFLYGRIDNLASDDSSPNTPAWMGTYNKTAWNAFKKMINDLRYAMRVSDLRIMPWVNYRTSSLTGAQWSNEPIFFDELQMHIPLHGIRKWNYFNHNDREASDDVIMDGILTDLNARFGTSKLHPVTTTNTAWDGDYVISGAIWNEQTVWRVTVNDGISSIDVDGTSYTLDTDTTRGVWHYADKNTTTLTVTDTT